VRGLVEEVAAEALHAGDDVVGGLGEGVAVAEALVDAGGEGEREVLDGEVDDGVVEEGGDGVVLDAGDGGEDLGDYGLDHVDGAGDDVLGAGHAGGEEGYGGGDGH